ncbi:MAG: hypothetical protein ABIQ77_10145 [Anaerolineales bacterium]
MIALLIGLITVRNYGESWDELQLYKYAGNSLTAYSTWPRTGEIPLTGDWFENYGPAFMMFSTLATPALTRLGFFAVDAHHFLYFLTFLLGVWSFFEICKRWMNTIAALGATLLFATQPLIWGHAFINPKDTTLLAMILFSVHLGLKMHDSLLGPQAGSTLDALTSAWANATKSTRRLLIAATLLWLITILILFGGTPFWSNWFGSSVRAVAGGQKTFLGPLILGTAENIHKVPPEIYIQKFLVTFIQLRALIFWGFTLILTWLYWKRLPSALKIIAIILPASIALGLTSSIRIFGPLAGILVAQHSIRNAGRKSVPVLATYATFAIFVMYASWPYLWPDPIGHLVETVVVMSHHPWNGLVLFDGATYAATDLPSVYMPTLLAIQLTEPVWILCALGLAVTVTALTKKRESSVNLLALAIIWFILPLVTFIIRRPTMYDNFRQAFFILPMVFVLAGVVIDQIRRPLIQGILVLLLITPGVVSSIRLHPYEYTYYNSLVGGLDGAFRKFELDYWGTSYRELALELNRIAPPNSTVWAEGPQHIFETYARSDLQIYSTYEAERADHYDYVISLSRLQADLLAYPDAPVIFSVTRAGAVLAVIKHP